MANKWIVHSSLILLVLQEEKVASAFPGAIPNTDLVSRVVATLEKYGYGETTMLTTSLCCDEVNRVLDHDFTKAYGSHHFSMGGLAGFPFGGVTSFGGTLDRRWEVTSSGQGRSTWDHVFQRCLLTFAFCVPRMIQPWLTTFPMEVLV
jgi:Limiting CO2-inducible proteins B/C beta carbonyic anhydrases